jgi:hypothetical protein
MQPSADEHNVRKGKQRSKRDRQSVTLRQRRRHLDVDGMGSGIMDWCPESAARWAEIIVHESIV